MTAIADATPSAPSPAPSRVKLDQPMDIRAVLIFLAVIAGALFFMAYSIYSDVTGAGGGPTTIVPFLLLGLAMLIALGFEFVNGFHDTANAVATVIYTHALRPQIAVVWSGCFNLLGVLTSTGAVAFGIVSLLPVELILQVGSGAGYAMVFALLISAIMWNLGTWWLGLPASSSHTLIGSIVGVGVANAMLRGQDGTAGVDWSQVTNIGNSLLLSPLFGFICAALLLLVAKVVIPVAALYKAPVSDAPPPLWIRGLSDPDLHARLLFPRLQRRAKGHGPHHAHSDRRRADRLRAQPRVAGKPDGDLHFGLGRRFQDRRRSRRRLRHHRRSAPGGDRLRARPQDLRGHLSVARRPDEADLRRSPAVRFARQGPVRKGREHAQRHVPDLGSHAHSRQGQGKRTEARAKSRRSARTRNNSISRPSSSRPGSRSWSRSRSASAR